MSNETKVTAELTDAISADFSVTPNDHAPDGAEIMGGVMSKGISNPKTQKTGFQAVINGIAGDIKPGFGPALTSALQKNNVVPANYDRPTKWTDIYKANKEPEIETLDDLSAEDQKAFKAGYKTIEAVIAAEEKAVGKSREVAFANAEKVHAVRSNFSNKTAWGMFQKMAPDAAVKAYLGKNAVGEAFRSHTIRALSGFDAETMLPSGVMGNKGVVTAYQGAINLFASNVVAAFHNDEVRETFTKATGANAALVAIARKMTDGQQYYVHNGQDDGAAEGFSKPNAVQENLLDVVAPAHVANWPKGNVIEMDNNGKFVAMRDDDGAFVAGTVFGAEGGDELVSAICRAMGTYEANRAREVAASVTDGLAKEAKTQGKAFADWDQKLAAEHLGRILFSRVDLDNLESTVADVNGILGMLGDWADEIADGADPADVVGTDAPASDAEGEEDADAAL